jgi:dipeptidyl aminopeptidase/acylaminoacyl peptidase
LREERVEFLSEGTRVVGWLRLPDTTDGPAPAVVQGPGWLGLGDAKAYVPWHRALCDAGIGVLVIDYRGHGLSDGERGWIVPDRMVEDIVNAVTYLETRPEIDPKRIGAFGMGGIGAGNAILAAGRDPRIRTVTAQSVVADGALWFQRMRREYEWVEFKKRVAEDARRYVTTGESELVNPRTDLMVGAPERASYQGKKDVDAKMEQGFHLFSAHHMLRYRPIDVVHHLAGRGLLLISVQDDAVTPDEHAVMLFEAASEPKRLVRQHNTTHYESYTQNFDVLSREIVEWYQRYLVAPEIEILSEEPSDQWESSVEH